MARILVIDDDRDLLEMIRLLLERRGEHEVTLSAGGRDGVSEALRHPPDLAIVDVMMPGMNGYDVCRRLREHPETASIPILVLTARGQPVDREAALQAGADEHIAKPVAMADLMKRIEDLLAERAARERTHTIVMVSLKGGIGVTTLAANLAATLVRSGQDGICLLDLSPSSGHAALHFGRRPHPNWSSLIEKDVVDAEDIESTLIEPTSGLYLVASPVVPLMEQTLARATVEAMLEILRERFDLVIVDAPSVLNETTMAALDADSDAWLVVAPDPASAQTAFGTLQALEERTEPSAVILNQVTPTRRASPDAIERVLKRSLSGIVPFEANQGRALSQGKPLALSRPDSPLAKAVQQLSDDLI